MTEADQEKELPPDLILGNATACQPRRLVVNHHLIRPIYQQVMSMMLSNNQKKLKKRIRSSVIYLQMRRTGPLLLKRNTALPIRLRDLSHLVLNFME